MATLVQNEECVTGTVGVKRRVEVAWMTIVICNLYLLLQLLEKYAFHFRSSIILALPEECNDFISADVATFLEIKAT